MSNGYVIPANASQDLHNMFTKATQAAANSMAPSTDQNFFHAWKKHQDLYNTNEFDPFKASDRDVAAYLSTRAEFTASPNVFKGGVLCNQSHQGSKWFST